MDAKAPGAAVRSGGFPRGVLASAGGGVAEAVAAAAGDVAMIIDRDGVIRDLALASDALEREGAQDWLDRPWLDTVTVESRPKVDALLRDAARAGAPRWREINQVAAGNRSMMVRFVALPAGHDGQVIAIGRDERVASALQQRLLEAQQTLERDYARLRDAEARYRLLFRLSGEAVLVVEAQSRRIVEANPAAERLLGEGRPELVGETFAAAFDGASRDEAASLIALAQTSGQMRPAQVHLSTGGRELVASASLFRQDRAGYCLVRLTRPEDSHAASEARGADLHTVLERIPDAFVATDAALVIVAANTAFLDLAGLGAAGQALGRPLSDFLGREGLERDILRESLRDHGSVRNFRTLLRGGLGEAEDVDVSAAEAPDGDETVYGVTLRPVDRRLNDRPHAAPELRQSIEQLTDLIGRMTLKDIVRETTDLVEQLCIEAALDLTKNNRASAAEVLGLSRQSLYSKLHRFGLGNLGG